MLHQILITDVRDAQLPDAALSNQKLFREYTLWDNDKIEKFLDDYFDRNVLDAYRTLLPYAYKADLARYCILYVYGGWYVDINIRMLEIPDVSGYDLFLIRDYNNGVHTAPWQLANGVIYAAPGHPVFKITIDAIVENCANMYYGKRTLSPTGPELFGRCVASYGWDHDRNNYLVGDFVDSKNGHKEFIVKNKAFAIHKTLPGGQVGVPGTNNYVQMWHSRLVYREKGL